MSIRWLVMTGIILVALFGYALNRGFYVGTRVIAYQGEYGQTWYARECDYLFPSGVSTTKANIAGQRTRENAENDYCHLFRR